MPTVPDFKFTTSSYYPRAFQRKGGDNHLRRTYARTCTYVLRPISSFSFQDTDFKL